MPITEKIKAIYTNKTGDFKEVSPLFEVVFIFPKNEPYFDILELQAELSKKQNVKTMKVDYLHGFMNFYSNNYNQSAYKAQLNWLRLNVC